MTITPSPEQAAIIEAATTTSDNLLISARAGAAKTTTLELIANALPETNAICLAFNKKIATELREALPKKYTVKTLNALGHSIWAQAIGKRLSLDSSKIFTILQDLIQELPKNEQKDAWDSSGFIMKSVGVLKSQGYLPPTYITQRKSRPIVSDPDEAQALLEEIPTNLEWKLIELTYTESLTQAFEGRIDFADQLLMPTIFRCPYPIHSLILVDEAQDLSELNFQMIENLYRKRIIAVGDQAQAIYAFRGASESGMSEMQHKFDMTEMHLSTSFRCPEAIVEHVRWRAPNMRAWDRNPNNPGTVTSLQHWSFDDLPDECAVLCRNNAPLFSMAIKLLKSGRYPNIWGNEISTGLLKVMKNLGPLPMTSDDALDELAIFEEKKLRKIRGKAAFRDRMACIRIFLRNEPTLGAAIQYAEHVFRSSGKVHFATGHKAKGSQFDNVFFLDENLLVNEGQDLNLRYVICTRAKRSLTYIESTGLLLDDVEDDMAHCPEQ